MSANLGLARHLDNIILSYNKCKSAEKVATQYNTSSSSIRYHLRKQNIACSGGNKRRDNLLPKILTEYKDNKKVSVNDIIKKYGISKKYFLTILKRENIELRDFNRSIFKTPAHYNLYNQIENGLSIYNKRKCIKDVARYYNLPPTGVVSIFKFCGYNLKEKTQLAKTNIKNININLITEEYSAGMHLSELAKKYNTSIYYIKQILSKNIKLRTKIEATKLQNSRFEHQIKAIKNNYKRKKFVLPSGRVAIVQGYEDDFLNYIFKNNLFKEEDICFKPPRIKYAVNRYYYPDFFIPRLNLLIEIKSNYTLKKTNPEKLKAAYNSSYNFLIIIDKDYSEFRKFINEAHKQK